MSAREGLIWCAVLAAIVVAGVALDRPAQRVTPQLPGEAIHSLTGYDGGVK